MDEAEVTGFGLPCFVGMAVVKYNLEEGVIMPGMVVFCPGGELLVSRHQRGGNVVSKEICLGVDMEKLDNIFIAHDTATASFRESLGRDDCPVVVRIIVSVSSNLLT